MSSDKNRIVITEVEYSGKYYAAYIVLDDKREVEKLQVFPPEEGIMVGSVYVGFVEKIVPSTNAAFVRIAGDTRCYLPMEDVKNPIYAKRQSKQHILCEGDEILVQVTREAVKTKDAVVSTKLTIHGNFCLVTTDNTRLGVSHKIPEPRSQVLKNLLEEICEDHEEEGYGVLFRTNSENQDDEILRADVISAVNDLNKIRAEGIHRQHGELIYSGIPGYISCVKSEDLSSADGVITDIKPFYDEIASRFSELKNNNFLQFYHDEKVSLSVLYGIGSKIKELTSKKVWLKSGANLIIETLETLTVIDVNSGKNISKKDDALFGINLEAAQEIARQLRLRNLSGMIIVDFINMKSQAQEDELISCLKRELKKDTVPATFIDITRLGLVEITRKKVYRALHEILQKNS